MAKQTFTTGQVLTAAQMTSLQQTAMLGGAANAKVASYVLVAADAGDAITMSNASPTTITVNTGLFAAGDIVTIINLGAGACTITAGTATVDTSGSLVLATNQGGVLRFTSASAAIFFQFATPASGDIEGVTAGTGISGGGTSGTVTITNSMATAIDAKGDLIVGTGADTFDKLSVGTNGHTLVADSAEATGLKWAAPAGGGANWSLLSSASLTGAATITISGISGADKIFLMIQNGSADALSVYSVRLNGDSAGNYNYFGSKMEFNSTYGAGNFTKLVSVGDSAIPILKISNTSSSNSGGYIRFDGCNASGVKTFISSGIGAPVSSDVQQEYRNLGGVYIGTSTISSISLISSVGNFDAGTVYVYTSA